jgi:hypothetical protein
VNRKKNIYSLHFNIPVVRTEFVSSVLVQFACPKRQFFRNRGIDKKLRCLPKIYAQCDHVAAKNIKKSEMMNMPVSQYGKSPCLAFM